MIDGNIATWSIVALGDVNGTYHGIFKFKCFLTPTERLAAGRDYRDLLGPNGALAFKREENLALTLAELKYRIVSAPPFWTSAVGINGQQGDIPDEVVLDKILEAAMASEIKYFAVLKEKKEAMIKKSKESAEKLLSQKEGEIAAEEGDDQS